MSGAGVSGRKATWSGLALVVLLATGCVTTVPNSPGAQAAEATPAAIAELDRQIFQEALYYIEDFYLDRPDLDHLGLAGLRAIGGLVPGTTVAVRGDELILGDGAPLAIPVGANSREWGRFVHDATSVLGRRSDLGQSQDVEAIYEAFLDGVTGELDRFSRYLNPEEAQDARAQREGYSGIGILLTQDEETGALIVRDVLRGGPSEEAGVAPGEEIIRVDGISVVGEELPAVTRRIRGRTGTDVTIGFRAEDTTEIDRTIERQRLIWSGAKVDVDRDFVILTVDRFNTTAASVARKEVERALDQYQGQPTGLILDLRGNPGGVLEEATVLADLFLDGGKILHSRGRDGIEGRVEMALAGDITRGLPIAVLVDDGSASASEIVAAALMDQGRAVVIGSNTFGKGSIQQIIKLDNDGEIYLTWQRFHGPAGYTVHEQGVVPTICTSVAGIDDGDGLDVDRFLAAYRAGQHGPPAHIDELRLAANSSQHALDQVREICPFKQHDPEFDLDVAKRLLSDQILYNAAVGSAPRNTLDHRPG